MKKKTFLALLCALIGTMTIGAAVGCGTPSETPNDTPPVSGDLGGENQGNENQGGSENNGNENQGGSENNGNENQGGENGDNENNGGENQGNENNGDETGDSEVNALTISSPTGVVYPYVDAARAFLEAGAEADVADYATKMDNPQVPIQVKWRYDAEGARKFLIEYATKADYSNAITVEMGAAKRSLELYNLYKGSKYYLRITAMNSKGETLHKAESQFETTDLGPRVINVDGAYNVRDLGGFDTCFGKKIVQGIAYRGGMLRYTSSGVNGNLTDAGRKTMSEELGIKAELDFRTEEESWVPLENGSSIPGATLTYITADGYENIFLMDSQREAYRKVFAYLSNKDNYPLYYHCTAGADRTGTVSYVLHAFHGVSELECQQDFAFTSFSIYGTRGSQSSTSEIAARYAQMRTLMSEQQGDTLQQKAENYLLSIGVTAEQLANIKGIFFGEIAIGNRGESGEQAARVTPVSMEKQAKAANELLEETLFGITLQKKED